MISQVTLVVGDVFRVLAVAEELVERLVVGEVLEGGELQPRHRHVIRVEVDRDDPLRLVDEVVENVAAAAGDRHDPRSRPDAEGLSVDARILPDLVVDEALEPEGEHPLEHPPPARRLVVMDRLAEMGRGHGVGRIGLGGGGPGCGTGHGDRGSQGRGNQAENRVYRTPG